MTRRAARTPFAQRGRRWGGAILLLALLNAGLALASDDGGTRSLFARGAGNRALALGGAFAALADDASATAWNPAGLGLLDRASFYAAHTDLIGMGFGEQYGSLVIPHWRIGTASLTYHRFGVDGIEWRDDRNVLLDENLEDSQTEMGLGFGRRIGRIWSLGALLKLQSHRLAGFSGSGAGLDLGVWVQPWSTSPDAPGDARSLSLGLALRNVLQPGVRLDQESVDDPPAVRGGAALRRGMGSFGSVVLAVDAEKTKDMDLRGHVGVEWQVLDMLAIRGGTNAGDLSAGLGIRWHDLTVDYAFEDNPLESVHRMGLGLAFGASNEEKRQKILALREKELQDRMNVAFEDERTQQIDDLIAQARHALDDGRPAKALDLAGTLRVLAPERQETPLIEAAAYRDIGLEQAGRQDLANAVVNLRRCLAITADDAEARRALDHCLAESDRHATRTAEIRRLFNQALQDLADEKFQAAAAGFRGVLAQNPGDAEATAMLQNTEQTMRLRTNILVEQAGALIRSGDFEQAAAVLARAEALSPGHPAVGRATANLAEQRRRRVEAARRAAEQPERPAAAPAESPPAAVELSPARLAELADLYRRGLAAADEGRQDDAVRYWEMVWSAHPHYQRVGDLLKREYLARGMTSFAAGDLEAAKREWGLALKIDPDDKRAQGYLARVQERQSRINEIKEGGR